MENNKENLPVTKSKEKESLFRKIINILNARWLQNGLTTVLLVLILFAIYLGVNTILEKVVLPEIDLTEDKIYSLSDETITKMKNIDKEVKIVLINYGEEDTFINIAEKYTTLSKSISLERIDDLEARTDIMQKYSLDATDKLIVISSGEKEKTLTDSDLYTYDYSTYKQIDLTEEALTNTIIDITTENKPIVYFMSNHITYSDKYFNTVLEALKDDANEVKTLDLLTEGAVPEDCNCLVITSLKEDITEGERDRIIEYINKGGELLLLSGINLTDTKFNNFQAVLDQYGITLEDGVIFEGNTSNMLSGYPYFIVEEMPSNSITKNINMSIKACFANSTSITIDEDKLEELGVEYETLMTTSDKAFIRTDLTQKSPTRTSQDSEEAEYTIGILATKKIDENTTSKIVMYSNDLFATNMSIQLMGYTYSLVDLYNNKDIAVNSIAYLNEREDIITIRKSNDTVSYTVTQLQNNIIMAIIFILPVVIIVIGIIVWQIRRRKK